MFNKLSKLDWSTPYGYGIKSLYANMNRINGTLCKDGKLFPSETSETSIKKRVMDKPCFSTSSYVPIQQQEFIEGLFTEKSKYER